MQRLIFALLGVTAAAVVIRPKRRKQHRGAPAIPTPSAELGVGGMASDEVVVDPGDVPPSADEYDNTPPCLVIPQPDGGEGIAGFASRYPHFAGGDGGYCTPPWDLEPEARTSAPFASVPAEHAEVPAPLWPIRTTHANKVRVSYRDVRGKWHGAWGRHVGSTRKGSDGSKRHHAGIDLYGDEGDVVVAMEPGEIIGMLPFHHGTWAVYVRNADGQIVNYGELAKHSWVEFGFPMQVVEGETDEPAAARMVRAGQPLGRIGLQSGGGTMLHMEMYEPTITLANLRAGELRWTHGESAPLGLLDPSRYLVSAQKTWFDKQATTA